MAGRQILEILAEAGLIALAFHAAYGIFIRWISRYLYPDDWVRIDALHQECFELNRKIREIKRGNRRLEWSNRKLRLQRRWYLFLAWYYSRRNRKKMS